MLQNLGLLRVSDYPPKLPNNQLYILELLHAIDIFFEECLT